MQSSHFGSRSILNQRDWHLNHAVGKLALEGERRDWVTPVRRLHAAASALVRVTTCRRGGRGRSHIRFDSPPTRRVRSQRAACRGRPWHGRATQARSSAERGSARRRRRRRNGCGSAPPRPAAPWCAWRAPRSAPPRGFGPGLVLLRPAGSGSACQCVRVAMGIQVAPRLRVIGARCPACRLEDRQSSVACGMASPVKARGDQRSSRIFSTGWSEVAAFETGHAGVSSSARCHPYMVLPKQGFPCPRPGRFSIETHHVVLAPQMLAPYMVIRLTPNL